MLLKGVDQIWTGDQGVAVPCLTTWLRRHIKIICSLLKKMTPTGFEPVLPPWKGGVLTTWPWSLISDRFTVLILYSVSNSPSRARTSDSTVNSRVLYQLSYRGLLRHIPSKQHTRIFLHLLHSSLLWLKPRPISNSQLHALPHFHLCPIYLVVFKGSY